MNGSYSEQLVARPGRSRSTPLIEPAPGQCKLLGNACQRRERPFCVIQVVQQYSRITRRVFGNQGLKLVAPELELRGPVALVGELDGSPWELFSRRCPGPARLLERTGNLRLV